MQNTRLVTNFSKTCSLDQLHLKMKDAMEKYLLVFFVFKLNGSEPWTGGSNLYGRKFQAFCCEGMISWPEFVQRKATQKKRQSLDK